MSKHGARQPEFKRLSNRIELRKRWYKRMIHRANRKRLHQSLDIETFKDKPLSTWALD